jgi:hypothetical protein
LPTWICFSRNCSSHPVRYLGTTFKFEMGSYFAVRLSIFLHWLYVFASSAAATGADLAILRSQLSPDASVSWTTSIAPRWSDYDAPKPTAIINVAVEKDVQTTVTKLQMLYIL